MQHYVDLNEPYLQINADLFNESNKDYLAVLGPPDHLAPPVPLPHTYVNGIQSMLNDSEELQTPNYLHMSPASGHVAYTPQSDKQNIDNFEYPPPPSSPTISNNLDNLSPQKSLRKKPGIPEEIPMLKSNHVQSDSDSEPSVSPVPAPRTFGNVLDDKLKASNNYINMPKIKNTASPPNTKDAVSNPGYVTITLANDTKS